MTGRSGKNLCTRNQLDSSKPIRKAAAKRHKSKKGEKKESHGVSRKRDGLHRRRGARQASWGGTRGEKRFLHLGDACPRGERKTIRKQEPQKGKSVLPPEKFTLKNVRSQGGGSSPRLERQEPVRGKRLEGKDHPIKADCLSAGCGHRRLHELTPKVWQLSMGKMYQKAIQNLSRLTFPRCKRKAIAVEETIIRVGSVRREGLWLKRLGRE